MRKEKIKAILVSSLLLMFFLFGYKDSIVAQTNLLVPIPNTLSNKCDCTGAQLVNKCGSTFYNLTNIKYKICTFKIAGPDTCTHYRTLQSGSIVTYQITACTTNPTITSGGPTLTATPNACTAFTDTFTGTTLDTTKWTVWKDIANTGTAGLENGQLKLSMPALSTATSYKQMGITNKTKLKGNFAVNIESVKSNITSGKQSGLTGLSIQNNNETTGIYRVAGKGKLGWSFKLSATNQGTAEVSVAGLTDAKSVVFRITRVNGIARLLYKIDNTGYKLLKQVNNFGTADVDLILLNGTGNPDYPAVNSFFDNLKVTCPVSTGGGTPTPTPTGINLACVCRTTGTAATIDTCSSQCDFVEVTGVPAITYPDSIKCLLPPTMFKDPLVAARKTDWCRRPQRTKGDANGDDKITFHDYFYYVSARFGGKIPQVVNPDFNGDGVVNNLDRVIIIRAL